MNPYLTGALRNTFEELAETASPPAGLASSVLLTARRQRVARRVAGGGVATGVCAALVGVVAAVAPTSGTTTPPDSTGPVAGTTLKPHVVTAYSGIRDVTIADSSPRFWHSLLLDPKTGRYERVPYRYVMPSPDGSRVVVGAGDGSTAHPGRVGVMDRASGNVRWIDDLGGAGAAGSRYPGDGRWSPDGQRILFTQLPRPGEPGFALVDPETLKTTFVPLPGLASLDRPPSLEWTPDGNNVALALTLVAEGGRATVTSIRFYDLTGALVRDVSTGPGVVALPPDFSPDGNSMALLMGPGGAGSGSIVIADPTTGAVRHTLTTPRFNAMIGWYDTEHLLLNRSNVRRLPSTGPSAATSTPVAEVNHELIVVDLTGRVVNSIPTITGERPAQQFIGPSNALPPPPQQPPSDPLPLIMKLARPAEIKPALTS